VSVAILQSVLNLQFPKTHVYFILAAGFFILSWVLLWLTIFRTTLGRWSLWAWLSTASFFAYLIHRPLWRIIDEFFGLEKDLSTVMIHLIPGAILALILGYLLQRGYDRLLAGLRLK
jgi:peptidoglycan/LPS O-acetylase OafA/YrhL